MKIFFPVVFQILEVHDTTVLAQPNGAVSIVISSHPTYHAIYVCQRETLTLRLLCSSHTFNQDRSCQGVIDRYNPRTIFCLLSTYLAAA